MKVISFEQPFSYHEKTFNILLLIAFTAFSSLYAHANKQTSNTDLFDLEYIFRSRRFSGWDPR